VIVQSSRRSNPATMRASTSNGAAADHLAPRATSSFTSSPKTSSARRSVRSTRPRPSRRPLRAGTSRASSCPTRRATSSALTPPQPLAAQVGTVLFPALVATDLAKIARDYHAAHPAGPTAARIGTWLGALVPRVMHPGRWMSAARFAGAEHLITGLTYVYGESALPHAADQLDAGPARRASCSRCGSGSMVRSARPYRLARGGCIHPPEDTGGTLGR
jgi:hypothetical protein